MIRVLMYYIGSKLSYKTNGCPEGERTSTTKSIGFIIKICIYSTNCRNSCEQKTYSYRIKRDHWHNKYASNRNENAFQLRVVSLESIYSLIVGSLGQQLHHGLGKVTETSKQSTINTPRTGGIVSELLLTAIKVQNESHRKRTQEVF